MSSPSTGTDSCTTAAQRAARVPLGSTNDNEVKAMLTACASYSEFSKAMKAHPDILGVSSVTDAEVLVVAQMLCDANPAGDVCAEVR